MRPCQKNSFHGIFKDVPIRCLGLAQRDYHFSRFGDVFDHADEVVGSTTAGTDERQGGTAEHQGTVLAPVPQLDGTRLAEPGENIPFGGGELRQIARSEEVGIAESGQFVARVAQLPRIEWIAIQQYALGVVQGDADAGVEKNGLEAGLTVAQGVLGAFLLGDVDTGGNDVGLIYRIVGQQGHGPGDQPFASVTGHQKTFEAHGVVRLVEGPQQGLEVLLIVWMYKRRAHVPAQYVRERGLCRRLAGLVHPGDAA